MNISNKTLLITSLCLVVQGCCLLPGQNANVADKNPTNGNESHSKSGGLESDAKEKIKPELAPPTPSVENVTPSPSQLGTTIQADQAASGKKGEKDSPLSRSSTASVETKGGKSKDNNPRQKQAQPSKQGSNTGQDPPFNNKKQGEILGPSSFLQVEYYYRSRNAGGYFSELKDGSQLFSKDLYSIKITPTENGFVYVYQVGSDSKIQDLMKQSRRPDRILQKDKIVVLPAPNSAFILRDNVPAGEEKIYVLGFKQPHSKLETQYDRYDDTLSKGGDVTKPQVELLEMLNEIPENAKKVLSFQHQEKPSQEKPK